MQHLWRFSLLLLLVTFCERPVQAELRVGVAVVDVTPPSFPVLVNGGMLSRSVDTVNTPVNARVLILDDGETRIGIAVVDSCMMPRPLLDDVKHLTAQRTKLQPDRILISATHTHSAPSCMGALGTDADPNYIPFLREKLVESFVSAEKNLEPAQVGWGVGQAPEFTALRRWIRRPDRLAEDPFGNKTVRANMHAGRNWDDVVGESGPEDPALSLISFRALDGRPLAVLANFSMHYFSDKAIGADYFGLFCEGLKTRLTPEASDSHPAFVGIMSHGCSGDIWRRDYTQPIPKPEDDFTIQSFTDGLLDIAMSTYEQIEYRRDADLDMAEMRLPLNYRVPDLQRLEWAKQVVAEMGDRPPKDTREVYAREQIILHELQGTEVVVQAVRIGEIGIATTPNETYALTGLKIKLQSPLKNTMVIELANGGDGYIPPPEQHLLGGYNTWAARSAGLEVTAEPKIAAAALTLLEQVTGTPSRPYQQPRGPAVQAILDAEPQGYWRLDEFQGPLAVDSSPHGWHAAYEMPVAFFLAGPDSEAFCGPNGSPGSAEVSDQPLNTHTNRATHFAGGRLHLRNTTQLGHDYTVSMWIWNGMPIDGRPVTGWMFSRGQDHGLTASSLHLGLGGAENHPGQLILQTGHRDNTTAGSTPVERWTWNHVALTRKGSMITVYLNGKQEFSAEFTHPAGASASDHLFFGGRSDNIANWEGRLDEIAVFPRALTDDEIAAISQHP